MLLGPYLHHTVQRYRSITGPSIRSYGLKSICQVLRRTKGAIDIRGVSSSHIGGLVNGKVMSELPRFVKTGVQGGMSATNERGNFDSGRMTHELCGCERSEETKLVVRFQLTKGIGTGVSGSGNREDC